MRFLRSQEERLTLSGAELESYQKFEKAVQEEYIEERRRCLLNPRGSNSLGVFVLLSKFRKVNDMLFLLVCVLCFVASKALCPCFGNYGEPLAYSRHTDTATPLAI